jgi:hypothetical protein
LSCTDVNLRIEKALAWRNANVAAPAAVAVDALVPEADDVEEDAV